MATAPGSPWGGAEGLTNDPWSSLLTKRMLAQGAEWSNAQRKESRVVSEALQSRERTPWQQGINTGTSTARRVCTLLEEGFSR
jgi:hypothetical protein